MIPDSRDAPKLGLYRQVRYGNDKELPSGSSTMTSETRPRKPLSKSAFISGEQCEKRLVLEDTRPDLAQEDSLPVQDRKAQGQEVGEFARMMFPDGLLVGHAHDEHEAALAQTEVAVGDPKIPAIFEAAFTYEYHPIRVDILERAKDGRFNINEVKSGTSTDKFDVLDLAFQVYVLRQVGIEIDRARIIHPDGEYVRRNDEIIAAEFFVAEDLTEEVLQIVDSIEERAEKLQAVRNSGKIPEIQPGGHCNNPVECPSLSHCKRELDPHDLSTLYRLHATRRAGIEAAEYARVNEISPAFDGLTDTQARQRDCVVANSPCIDHDSIGFEFSKLRYPLYFLDFESVQFAIPRYRGTRPQQQVLFQYSLHVLHQDGTLTHSEYLAPGEGGVDPRIPLIEKLLSELGDEGSIEVFSSFEKTRLREIARDYPEFQAAVDRIEGRLFDALPVIRRHSYHPLQKGSFSIKAVLPAWLPELSYQDLEIQDGAMAAVLFKQLASPHLSSREKRVIRANLLAYCRRDTEAMVRLHQFFDAETRDRTVPGPEEVRALAFAAWEYRREQAGEMGQVIS